MRIYTRVVKDIETGHIIHSDYYECSSPIALCKGGASREAQRRANAAEEQRNEMMRQQLELQRKQIDFANPFLQDIIRAGGMPPSQEAAMRSIAINDLSGQFTNLRGALQNRLTQRGVTGGAMAGGGDIGREFGNLGALEAGEQARLLSGIQVEKGHGLMDALRTSLGLGGMYGSQALGFGGQAIGALGIGQQAARARDEAGTGFWGSLFGALGQVGSGFAGRPRS